MVPLAQHNRLGTDQPVPTDWLHANSVSWSPADDDLVVSLPLGLGDQDRLRQREGQRSHRLEVVGAGGNFKAIANTPTTMVPHQHDVRYINDNTLLWSSMMGTPSEEPAGRIAAGRWINEQNMTAATLVVNADVGTFLELPRGLEDAPQRQPGLHVRSLLLVTASPLGSQSRCFPNGTKIYVQQMKASHAVSVPISGEHPLQRCDLLD